MPCRPYDVCGRSSSFVCLVSGSCPGNSPIGIMRMKYKANTLANHWMPFTGNRDFKANPRLVVRGEGCYYWDHKGGKIIDASSGTTNPVLILIHTIIILIRVFILAASRHFLENTINAPVMIDRIEGLSEVYWVVTG